MFRLTGLRIVFDEFWFPSSFPAVSLMLSLIVWFVLAWVGGAAAILGSLMAVASLLLWFVPHGEMQGRVKVMGFAIAVAIAGFLLLRRLPVSFYR